MRKSMIALALTVVPALAMAQANGNAGVNAQANGRATAGGGRTEVKTDAQVDVHGRARAGEARAHGASQANAHANGNAAAHASDASVFGDMSAEARAQLQAELEAARRSRVPERPIRDRVIEGRAKGAADAQLVAAAQRVRVRLEASQQAMVRAGRAEPKDDEVTQGANAMERGTTSAQITALARAAGNDRSLAVAFETLTRLQADGVPVDQAVARIRARLEARASDDAIGSLGASANARGGVNAGGVNAGGASVSGAAGAAAGVTRGAGSVGGTVSGVVGGAVKP